MTKQMTKAEHEKVCQEILARIDEADQRGFNSKKVLSELAPHERAALRTALRRYLRATTQRGDKR